MFPAADPRLKTLSVAPSAFSANSISSFQLMRRLDIEEPLLRTGVDIAGMIMAIATIMLVRWNIFDQYTSSEIKQWGKFLMRRTTLSSSLSRVRMKGKLR